MGKNEIQCHEDKVREIEEARSDIQRAIVRFEGPGGVVRRAEYLALVAETGLLAHSARAVGVDPGTPPRLAKRDKAFAASLQDAKDIYADTVRQEVQRRALHGVEQSVIYKGEDTGIKRTVHSDRLAEVLVKAKCPEFREQFTADVNIRGGVLVVTATTVDPEQWSDKHGGQRVPVVNRAARDAGPPREAPELSDADRLSDVPPA